jgi:arylamine N-acetyltransferase
VTDEWDADRLDLGANLARVGHTGTLGATGETLHALHRRHVAAIPFETWTSRSGAASRRS